MGERFLGEAQQLIWRLVTAPEGVAQGLADEGDAGGRALGAMLKSDERLSAPARLSVYANAYFYRIRDALREDFGALHAALGERPFHNLVTGYLIAHPPAHFSLRYVGRHLAGYLAADPSAAALRAGCPFAADLCALEWALLEAFDAPDAPVLAREALAAVPTDAWASLRFSFTPSLQILELAWPVQKAREIHDAEGDPGGASLEKVETTLRVWRRSERVFYRPVSRLEAASLACLRGGGSFGDVCEIVSSETGEGEAAREGLALLERWLADGLLSELLP